MDYYKNLDLADINYINKYGAECIERWKDVTGYEEIYKISDLGRLKSLDRLIKRRSKGDFFSKGRIRKQAIDKDDYHIACLGKNGNKEYLKIHRLVAIHFIPNPENKPEVNHIGINEDGKQGNKKDNRVISLQWATTKENSEHAWENGLNYARKGTKHHNCILTESQVIEIRKLALDSTKTYSEIGLLFNVSNNLIGRIIRRNRWKHI